MLQASVAGAEKEMRNNHIQHLVGNVRNSDKKSGQGFKPKYGDLTVYLQDHHVTPTLLKFIQNIEDKRILDSFYENSLTLI